LRSFDDAALTNRHGGIVRRVTHDESWDVLHFAAKRHCHTSRETVKAGWPSD
jgi:hypothetical protein